MELNRRQFLQAGGTAAVLGTAGCDAPHKTLWPYTGLPNEAKPPFAPPSGESIDLATHTLNRLTFGARPGQHARILRLAKREENAVDKFIDEQLAPEKINDDRAEFRVQKFETLALAPIGEFYEFRPHILREELTRATLTRAVYSERQLYEVMVRFWSDHFNIDISKGECKWLKPADDRDVIRQHALGKFPELLAASARSQAMLTFLDGRENRVRKPEDRPNENYARELLELHTLGIHGGYTQQDVMEIARCLSGWRIGRGLFQVGKVQFEPELHDNRTKTVLGEAIPVRTGRDGRKDFDDVLRIVAAHPSTGRHIAAKLCQRFIADEPPAAAIEIVAREFTKTKGDIRETLRALFGTDEFRGTRGNKFKQPLHFLASALRGTDAETDAARPLVNYLARMGHMPFEYPAPDGYPAHAEPWMITLLWRWNFAAKLAQGRINGTKIQRERLPKRAGDLAKLAAHLLGHQPSDGELAAAKASKNPIGLLLASPSFQWS